MELQRVIDLLSIECECVSRDCDRNCAACDLVQEKNELISAYRHAIRTIQMVAQVAFCKFCGQKLDWSDENGEV